MTLREQTEALEREMRGKSRVTFYLLAGDAGLAKLAEGRIADITVFDAERVRDTSEFTDSVRKPEGICHVLVGGEFALRQGRSAGGRKGAVIRRESGGPV